MSLPRTNCHKCVHSRSNSFINSAHIHCDLYWRYYKKRKSEHPQSSNEYAITNGWWDFPYDYDPVWMQDECKHFEKKEVKPESKL